MKATELVKLLEKAIEVYGDREVCVQGYYSEGTENGDWVEDLIVREACFQVYPFSHCVWAEHYVDMPLRSVTLGGEFMTEQDLQEALKA